MNGSDRKWRENFSNAIRNWSKVVSWKCEGRLSNGEKSGVGELVDYCQPPSCIKCTCWSLQVFSATGGAFAILQIDFLESFYTEIILFILRSEGRRLAVKGCWTDWRWLWPTVTFPSQSPANAGSALTYCTPILYILIIYGYYPFHYYYYPGDRFSSINFQ